MTSVVCLVELRPTLLDGGQQHADRVGEADWLGGGSERLHRRTDDRFVLERNCHFGGQLSGAERLGLRRCRLGRTIDGERHLSRVRRMFGIGVRRRRPGRVGGGGRR